MTTWLHTALAAVCAALLAQAGCYGDLVSTRSEPGAGDTDGGGPLGGGGGGGVGGADAAPISGDAGLVCVEAQSTTETGNHFPGTPCTGCHNGSNATRFTVAGTLFAEPGGTTAVTGVTVTLIDADQNRIDMVSARNGNFWTGQPVAFPVTTYASSCPDLIPMNTLADSGDCNGCHAAGLAITFAP